MSRNRNSSEFGEFRVDTYGSGEPNTMAIGGLAYAPSDFSLIAEHLEGTLHVVNNPIHTGAVKRTQDWQEWLRLKYADICKALQSKILIGHSCGSFDAVHITKHLPDLEGLVMLAPPYGKAGMSDTSRREDFGLLDRCLAGLCSDLSDHLYAQMLEDHRREYEPKLKDIFRNEIPKRESCIPNINHGMSQARSRILVILATDDPWNNDADPPSIGNHIDVARMQSGHYPHMSKPMATADMINQWINRARK